MSDHPLSDHSLNDHPTGIDVPPRRLGHDDKIIAPLF